MYRLIRLIQDRIFLPLETQDRLRRPQRTIPKINHYYVDVYFNPRHVFGPRITGTNERKKTHLTCILKTFRHFKPFSCGAYNRDKLYLGLGLCPMTRPVFFFALVVSAPESYAPRSSPDHCLFFYLKRSVDSTFEVTEA